MEAYAKALEQVRGQVEGKVVLDVGAGTGVLSLLCARICRPRAIYAVEATEATARLAEELVKVNGLEGVITVVNCAVEDLDLGEEGGGVDVIISEWMGYYLLHEGMLDSVLRARDLFLRPGGLMLPTSARVWVALCDMEPLLKEKVDLWHGQYLSKYDLSFAPVGVCETMRLMQAPQVVPLAQDSVLSEAGLLCELDLTRVKSEDLNQIEGRWGVG